MVLTEYALIWYSSTLDALEDMGHIVNLENGMAYKAVEQKGKRPNYGTLHYG